MFTQKNKNSKWELSKEQDKQLIGKLTNLTVMFDRKTVTSNEESNPFPPKNTDNLNSKEYDFELSLIDKYHQNAVKKFNTYLDKAFKRYSREKTLLDPNSYSNITYFYVSNNIEIKSTIIENPTVTKLTKISKHLIIQGTAGLGKTTLIKYLFINASKSVSNSGIIPILVDRLNRYSGESILDYVSKNVQEFDSNVSLADIENAFNNSSLLLLIDGIDEIKHKYTTGFILQLESFLNMYFNTHIIITSRPVDDFMQFSSFIVGKICPFSVEQSIMFVEKQKF